MLSLESGLNSVLLLCDLAEVAPELPDVVDGVACRRQCRYACDAPLVPDLLVQDGVEGAESVCCGLDGLEEAVS